MKKLILKISSCCIIFFAIILCACEKNNVFVGTNWVASIDTVDSSGDALTVRYQLNFISNTNCSLKITAIYERFMGEFDNVPSHHFSTSEYVYTLSDSILIDNKYKGTINGNQMIFDGTTNDYELYDIYGLTFTEK
jgi:hypothetical protein